MPLSKKYIQSFQQMIFDWWKANKRDLPWRHTFDPYKIMVSEVMLQQTQVERVLTRYIEFIEAYPTVHLLARAKTSDVLRLWKGMGYNRRALYLKQTAQAILELHNGIFPVSEEALVRLPGIGRYTARAILVFSFKKDMAMVDTNIRKIITNFFFQDQKQPEKVIQEVADKILPRGKSWEWHQAMMDFGADSQLKIKDQKSKIKKKNKSIPFYQSNRFYRGRIMDLLREKKYEHETLLEELVKTFKKPKSFFEERIASLVKDGLAVQKEKFIRLPS
ncbi:MAG: HhH-GPD family protein [Candidatus Gottesmanbacteria bacterium GW2011_GWA2_44_17]|uniref:Adenine DNA glycosylase n=3 Tax=Candidatus Gottesmaniibacteriota TaxID=1752720 RepID=A0A0G1KW59_9BACT|nr:MAG: HhH-GPD family protein [Microgenomates group bacterium GW2011_GWC1_43_11]KKT38724.1 MAG: HhH-GPD family protein [Candidatus Gottesmanbacteria bacterium GW2011_GWB1_44_11c]KKT47044.1 MAG: HhH-GPD family protein [Candidatus Gottesmanbacteria bacterium GW2011_GWA2_44_17]KKT60562.1 MAG: HhH-GPD family protein [Candidatus Gottesmanbacteria bacterium GW2011_GWA1_44_24b]HCM82592.1 Fe-S cluster assembly protein HesB [Patescibacteria group bacterium]